MWSWHIQDNDEGEGIKLKAPILTLFSVDNFLRDIEPFSSHNKPTISL